MKAAVLEEYQKPLVIRDVDIGEPDVGEITIKVMTCGLCLTDVHISEGRIPTVKLPLIPGHEFAGVVAEKGSEVTDIEIGDRVVASVDILCGKCDFCLRGETNLCVNLIRIGFEKNGGMADYVNVPAANVEKLSDRVSFEKAAIIPDAVTTMYRAIKVLGEVSAGSHVAILGIGGLGMQGIKIGKMLGANITCTSRNQMKLEKAQSLGAYNTINTKGGELSKILRGNEGNFDAVIDNIGTRESVLAAIKLCRNGGKAVIVGYVDDFFEVPSYEIVVKEKKVIGSRSATRSEFREVVQIVNRGQLDPDIGELIPIYNVNQALENLKSGKYLTRSVLTLPFDKTADI